jgi:hypothetical protein
MLPVHQAQKYCCRVVLIVLAVDVCSDRLSVLTGRRIVIILAALTIMVSAAQKISFAQISTLPAGGVASPCAHVNGQFMETDGINFCFQGKPVYLHGATMYPYWLYKGALYRSRGWAQPEFKQYIDTILGLALSAKLNTIRPTDYLSNARTWSDPTIWNNMDYLVRQAQRRHLWIILDLSTFRQWLTNQGHSFVYNLDDWRPFVRFVTQRYRNVVAISHYSIAGEINSDKDGGVTADQYAQFYQSVLSEIHSGDRGHHLISIGGLSYLNIDPTIPWQTLYDLPFNNIVALHIYSDGDRTVTLPMVAAWAHTHNKPLLIEEFGFRQALGDKARAQAYADLYREQKSYNAGGTIFWNLGMEVAPNSFDVNPDTPLTWAAVQHYP